MSLCTQVDWRKEQLCYCTVVVFFIALKTLKYMKKNLVISFVFLRIIDKFCSFLVFFLNFKLETVRTWAQKQFEMYSTATGSYLLLFFNCPSQKGAKTA